MPGFWNERDRCTWGEVMRWHVRWFLMLRVYFMIRWHSLFSVCVDLGLIYLEARRSRTEESPLLIDFELNWSLTKCEHGWKQHFFSFDPFFPAPSLGLQDGDAFGADKFGSELVASGVSG